MCVRRLPLALSPLRLSSSVSDVLSGHLHDACLSSRGCPLPRLVNRAVGVSSLADGRTAFCLQHGCQRPGAGAGARGQYGNRPTDTAAATLTRALSGSDCGPSSPPAELGLTALLSPVDSRSAPSDAQKHLDGVAGAMYDRSLQDSTTGERPGAVGPTPTLLPRLFRWFLPALAAGCSPSLSEVPKNQTLVRRLLGTRASNAAAAREGMLPRPQQPLEGVPTLIARRSSCHSDSISAMISDCLTRARGSPLKPRLGGKRLEGFLSDRPGWIRGGQCCTTAELLPAPQS